MNKKDKDLLIKDLCARLPYGVKVCARFNTGNRYTANVTAISADRDYIQVRRNELHPYTGSSAENIRPYLRPLSSMTEEEKRKYYDLTHQEDDDVWAKCLFDKMVDFCNERHLDYRGLIPMRLALEAPDDMYKQ